METACVIGAGMSGASIARLWAEAGMAVHVWEASDGVGGAAVQVQGDMRLEYQNTADFLAQRTTLRFRPHLLHGYQWVMPAYGYKPMIEELLYHPNIIMHLGAEVRGMAGLLDMFSTPYVVLAARPDHVLQDALGTLRYHGYYPDRDELSMTRYGGYKRILQKMRVIGMGAAHYQMYSLEQCVCQALWLSEQDLSDLARPVVIPENTNTMTGVVAIATRW